MFCSPKEIGDAEAKAGFDVLLAATNHALDRGNAGILTELDYMRTNFPEAEVIGISAGQEEYDRVYMFEKDDFKVAILNFTFSTNGIPMPEENPWAVNMLDYDKVARDVQTARDKGADLVVVFVHWGTEYQTYADEYQMDWARTFRDLGVDAVIGGHPHVIEPGEVLEGADGLPMPVLYSVGNYVSTQVGADNMIGGMAKLRMVKDDAGARVVSCEMWPTVTHIADGANFSAYLLRDYNEELAQQNHVLWTDGRFSADWCRRYCAEVLGEGYDSEACIYRLDLSAASAEELPQAA